MLTSTVTVVSFEGCWFVTAEVSAFNVGTMLTSSSVTTPSTMRNERISSESGSRVDTRR